MMMQGIPDIQKQNKTLVAQRLLKTAERSLGDSLGFHFTEATEKRNVTGQLIHKSL